MPAELATWVAPRTTMPSLTPDQLATLIDLATGILPADELDGGASSVDAAPRLAERIAAGVNAALYFKGLDLAHSFATEKYTAPTTTLTPTQLHALLPDLRDPLPAFFKQLRMDVSAL